MVSHRLVHTVEFLNPDGTKIELSQEGWRVLNIRSMGEVQRLAALALLARVEAIMPYPPEEPRPLTALTTDAEYVATRVGLRITHRRWKDTRRR
jgi:hypothetical protein